MKERAEAELRQRTEQFGEIESLTEGGIEYLWSLVRMAYAWGEYDATRTTGQRLVAKLKELGR